MRYIVDVVKELPSSANFNAWAKAPADVIRSLIDTGAKTSFVLIPNSRFKLFNFICGVINTFKICFDFNKGDVVYLQKYGYYISLLTKLCHFKGVRLEYIVHDLTFLRLSYNCNNQEANLLRKMDCIYVHTENMEAKLRSLGYTNEMKVFHLFDYYSDDLMVPENIVFSNKTKIAFAGNLNKSNFLFELHSSKIPNSIQYLLYGLKPEIDFDSNPQMKYSGAFQPNHPGIVCAGWGLLWDGDSIDTCSGLLGEYLKINSSHKISLYLSCGIPIIIWSQSSLYKWLNDYGVCIAVNSLKEIGTVISQLDDKAYIEMIRNARKIGSKLRAGQMLKEKLSV